jgi:hypothetical protein
MKAAGDKSFIALYSVCCGRTRQNLPKHSAWYKKSVRSRPAFKSSDRVTGIAWALGEYHGHSTVSHSGGDTGFASNLVLIPDLKIAVIVMTNCDYISIRPLTNVALDVAVRETLGFVRSGRTVGA